MTDAKIAESASFASVSPSRSLRTTFHPDLHGSPLQSSPYPTVILSRLPIRAVMLFAACLPAAAQVSTQAGVQAATQAAQDPAIPPTVKHHPHPHVQKLEEATFNPNVIVLDPAHGGSDEGAHLAGGSLEKDVTVAFAARLKPMLEARGFTVILTHAAATDQLPDDARVELANRSHAVACIILHASPAGHGVHLFTSSLTPVTLDVSDPALKPIMPWDSAQAGTLVRSAALMNDLGTAMNGARIPLVAERVSVHPIDSLSCPAIVLELAPLAAANASGQAQAQVGDGQYQQRVAEAAVSALTVWRTHATASAMQAAIARQGQLAAHPETPGTAPALPKSKAKAKAKPAAPAVAYPDEAPPDAPAAPARQPAPVIRQTPPAAVPQGAHR